jgi:hypothetical protein
VVPEGAAAQAEGPEAAVPEGAAAQAEGPEAAVPEGAAAQEVTATATATATAARRLDAKRTDRKVQPEGALSVSAPALVWP